jgi:hypothetical protein
MSEKESLKEIRWFKTSMLRSRLRSLALEIPTREHQESEWEIAYRNWYPPPMLSVM